MIKVGSDFSGVGAFNQALIRLGIPFKEIFACDMDKYARQTFIHNYGEPDYYPTNVYNREIPSEPLDIYMTSPPCQAFSLAGKRLGKEDQRGILFFNSHEFIKVNKPRFFIFENVKGLLSDDNGNTFNEWVNLLAGKSVNGLPVMFPYEDSVPYHLYWKVLNAKHHGVPQNRERVFLIGIRDDRDNKFRFPAEEYLKIKLKDVLQDAVDKKYYLIDEASEGDSINFSVPSSETRRGRVGKGVAQTLDTSCNQGVICAAIIGRDSENGLQQQLELGSDETSNSLTTVQKDNVILLKENENKFRFYKDDYKKSGIQGMDIIKPNGIADTITNNHPGNVMIYNNKRLNETIEKHGLLDGEIKDNVLIYKEFRTEEAKKKRKETGTNDFRDKECGFFEQDYANTLTNVQKDNKILIGDYRSDEGFRWREDGNSPTLHTNLKDIDFSEKRGQQAVFINNNYRIRRLTPRECFRLMDFPDTFTWPVSDSQAYKQAGNSIVVNVLYKILKNLPL